jgi:hypothetical protein
MFLDIFAQVALGMTAGSTLWLALRAGKVVINAEMQSELLRGIITQQMELIQLQVGINEQVVRRLNHPTGGWSTHLPLSDPGYVASLKPGTPEYEHYWKYQAPKFGVEWPSETPDDAS